jgi:hypothetical protein
MNCGEDTMENQSRLEQIIRAKVLVIKMLEENGKFRRPSFSKLPIDYIIKLAEQLNQVMQADTAKGINIGCTYEDTMNIQIDIDKCWKNLQKIKKMVEKW